MKIKYGFFCGAICALSSLFAQSEKVMLFEAEDFQFAGDWNMAHFSRQDGLFTTQSNSEPMTFFELSQAGLYHVWVSSVDNAETAQGTRLLNVFLDSQKLPKEAGKHGKDGVYWENVGSMQLSKGVHKLSIKRKTQFVRCDALLITSDENFNPNSEINNSESRNKFTPKPYKIPYELVSTYPKYPALKGFQGAKNISISNNDIKIFYTEKKSENGEKYFERSVQICKNGKWINVAPFSEEYLLLIKNKNPKFKDTNYFAAWDGTNAKNRIMFNGDEIFIQANPANPYIAGDAELLMPKSITKISEKSLKIIYNNSVSATLTLSDSGQIAKFDVKGNISEESYYSFAFLGFNGVKTDAVEFTLLPAIYQGKRLMSEPKMVTTTMTSQPLAALQTTEGGITITSGVMANPSKLPFEWAYPGNAKFGFSLSNCEGAPQVAVFYPILGGENSFKKAGEELEASWYLASISGDWQDFLTEANTKIFAASTLRESLKTSFSDTICNIANYMSNERFSGWDKIHKGRWNIESKSLVTHSAPLAELEIALLKNDEDYYKRIALPTIEFMLSRPGSHFSIYTPDNLYTKNPATLKIGAKEGDMYANLDFLLNNKNEWLKKFYLDENSKLIIRNPEFEWQSLLGYYIINPSPELLDTIKKKCDAWLSKNFDNLKNKELNLSVFVNVSNYPYWWYLPEMYKATGDKKYLEYARKGAFYTLSCLWNFPTPPEGNVVINKDNKVFSVHQIWWYGEKNFRMGHKENKFVLDALKEAKDIVKVPYFSRTIQAQKTVDAMSVSRIGVGIEQYSTYTSGDANQNNIIMPSWSAEMLKTYQHTKDDTIMKFSRHAIIGRFANFVGYYIKDFSDIMLDPLYPYTGPDITSFYYHHAPCQFAQSFDYLMAQLEVASADKINFPYVRQKGYVWFTDRIFGLEGEIFGDKNCRLNLDESAVKLNTTKASFITARSQNSIWVIILNDSAIEREIEVEFNPTSKSMKGADTNAEVVLYNSSGNPANQKFSFFGDKKIKVAAQDLIAFKIPASTENRAEKSLKAISAEGHQVIKEFHKDFGDLHLFRIRSPFGKDSIYIVLSKGQNQKKAVLEAKISLDSAVVKLSKNAFPFEISAYPIPAETPIEIEVSLRQDGKELLSPQKVILK